MCSYIPHLNIGLHCGHLKGYHKVVLYILFIIIFFNSSLVKAVTETHSLLQTTVYDPSTDSPSKSLRHLANPSTSTHVLTGTQTHTRARTNTNKAYLSRPDWQRQKLVQMACLGPVAESRERVEC